MVSAVIDPLPRLGRTPSLVSFFATSSRASSGGWPDFRRRMTVPAACPCKDSYRGLEGAAPGRATGLRIGCTLLWSSAYKASIKLVTGVCNDSASVESNSAMKNESLQEIMIWGRCVDLGFAFNSGGHDPSALPRSASLRAFNAPALRSTFCLF